MKKFWLAIVAVVSIASTVFAYAFDPLEPDGRYDNHSILVDPAAMDIEAVMRANVNIIVTGTYKLLDGPEIPFQNSVSATVVLGRYLISVGHGLGKDETEIFVPFIGLQKAKKLTEKFFLDSDSGSVLTLIHASPAKDIAIFQMPDGIARPSYPYTLGDSDGLKVANFIYSVGRPLGDGVNVRPGVVSALQIDAQFLVDETENSEDYFMLSTMPIPGESGGQIVAICDGKFEWVGLPAAVHDRFPQLGTALRINTMRDVILNECSACADDLKQYFRKSGQCH